MHSIRAIFIFLYDRLLLYYKEPQLTYFVSNQLIKLIFQNDYLLLDKTQSVEDELIIIFKQYIDNITVEDMPYQYLLKQITFCGAIITVEAPILIPRIETEELVYWLIQKLSLYKNNFLNIVDFCSGTGCIGIALLHFFKNSNCTAFDICHKSVQLSSYNAFINNVKKRYKVYQKDILTLKKNKKYNIIISNPPYITFNDYQNLDLSVKKWESLIALTDKKDGYLYILYLLQINRKKLNKNGIIIIEICHSYSDFILKKAKEIYKKEYVFLWKDQYNKDRAIIVSKGEYTNLLKDYL